MHLHKNGVIAFPESYSIPRFPDYPNDLNAMHEAEKMLNLKYHDTRTKYYMFLMRSVKRITNCDSMHWSEIEVDYIYACIHATASQRAEAFLRTLNLWKE